LTAGRVITDPLKVCDCMPESNKNVCEIFGYNGIYLREMNEFQLVLYFTFSFSECKDFITDIEGRTLRCMLKCSESEYLTLLDQ